MDIFDVFVVPFQNFIFISIAVTSWLCGWFYLGRELLAVSGPKLGLAVRALCGICIPLTGIMAWVWLVGECVFGVPTGLREVGVTTFVIMVAAVVLAPGMLAQQPAETSAETSDVKASDRVEEVTSVAMLLLGSLASIYVLSIR